MKSLNDLLKTETDERLLRLFAVGCCRQIWRLLIDQRSKTAVEIAEKFADGKATKKELDAAENATKVASNDAANNAAYWASYYAVNDASYAAAYWAAYFSANNAACSAAYAAVYVTWGASYAAAHDAAREKQLELYHCIFTKIVFTTTNQNVFKLAKLIYKERQWSLMPILGDALEEGGCTAEVISHCKEKEHARGCWVVDNILGKR